MELRRIDLRKAAELVGGLSPALTRERNTYDEGDCRELVAMIGRTMCPPGREFVIDSENAFVYENVRRWCDGNPDFTALDPRTSKPVRGDIHKGLYIAGNPGSGKTLCTRVFAKYLSVLGLGFTARDGGRTGLAWRSYYSSEICGVYARTGDVSQIVALPSLCVQDAGSEPPETVYMGNKVSVIGHILQMRGERRDIITVITSNNRIREDIYGDRVTSRLCQMCNYFELKGADRRQ